MKPTVDDRIAAIKAQPIEDRPQLIRKIGSSLKDRSPRVREIALKIATDQLLAELEPQVRDLLSDKNDFVRQNAIQCLGDLHEGEAIEATWLYPLLKHPDELTRVETLETLAWIGDRKALPLIAELLSDKDSLVRSYAAISLAELNGRQFRKQIQQASNIEAVEAAKPRIAEALFLLGDSEIQFEKLIGLLSSTNPTARCATANALANLPLSDAQQKSALRAISHAAKNFLAPSDRITMEIVAVRLLEQLATPCQSA